jgi:DNA-binding NarL/FixJ family response regulator
VAQVAGVVKMSTMRVPRPIRVGLVADEPLRLVGLTSIFDGPTPGGQPPLIPVIGTLKELLAMTPLEYLVLDLNASSAGLGILEAIRRTRPAIRLIVIGPEGNDELVLESIIAGARAYLDSSAGPQMVRQAIDVVTSGSIWAPRRLLSKLIDRLLSVPDAALSNANPYLTVREQQVLDLILLARSNREIARQLGIEERTVKAHVGSLMRKTGVDNRIELSMRILSRPIVPHPHADNPQRRATDVSSRSIT